MKDTNACTELFNAFLLMMWYSVIFFVGCIHFRSCMSFVSEMGEVQDVANHTPLPTLTYHHLMDTPPPSFRSQRHQNLSTMSEMFSWSLPGLNRRHLTAFANLLALRNGGQVEPASLRDELLDQDNLDDDSDGGSIDTSRPRRISDSGHDRLKRNFLDCLAEITANKKGESLLHARLWGRLRKAWRFG